MSTATGPSKRCSKYAAAGGYRPFSLDERYHRFEAALLACRALNRLKTHHRIDPRVQRVLDFIGASYGEAGEGVVRSSGAVGR